MIHTDPDYLLLKGRGKAGMQFTSQSTATDDTSSNLQKWFIRGDLI